jgi:hypothetical protein
MNFREFGAGSGSNVQAAGEVQRARPDNSAVAPSFVGSKHENAQSDPQGGSAAMDKIEIVYFETDGGVRQSRNHPTVITELTYCEWRRNGAVEFARATDQCFTKTGEGGWGYIPDDVLETLALMIAPSIIETLRPFASAADWHDGEGNEAPAYPSLTVGELRAARDLVRRAQGR